MLCDRGSHALAIAPSPTGCQKGGGFGAARRQLCGPEIDSSPCSHHGEPIGGGRLCVLGGTFCVQCWDALFLRINRRAKKREKGLWEPDKRHPAVWLRPLTLPSGHVTCGLPFVILCLRMNEGGWEGKGTFSCHHQHLPCLPPSCPPSFSPPIRPSPHPMKPA